MTYTEALDFLYNQYVSFHKLGKQAFSGKLEPIQLLCDKIKNPQNNYPVIHVAGTNGKGSTASVIAAILNKTGLKVGLYTSPHLYDFRERIRVNGEMMHQDSVVKWTQILKEQGKDLPLSFFEITTTMAFAYFDEEKVDVTILETGLGGRLDATNIVKNKIASVITPIGLDHIDILGNTIEEIAGEKAGIIPRSKFCLTNNSIPSVVEVIKSACQKNNSEIIELPVQKNQYKTDLLSDYQQMNIHLAFYLCKNACPYLNVEFDENAALAAIQNVKSLSGLMGRFEKVSSSPDIYFDVAHNEEGVKHLMNEIKHLKYKKVHFVFGASKDKDLNKMAQHFITQNAHFYFTPTNNMRTAVQSQYQELMNILNLEAIFTENPQQALSKAISNASTEDIIVVFGSFFLFENLKVINIS